VAGCCQHHNKPACSIKRAAIIDQLSNARLVENKATPREELQMIIIPCTAHTE
jgi:hypothetical protein